MYSGSKVSRRNDSDQSHYIRGKRSMKTGEGGMKVVAVGQSYLDAHGRGRVKGALGSLTHWGLRAAAAHPALAFHSPVAELPKNNALL
jgi:hypothetical protein